MECSIVATSYVMSDSSSQVMKCLIVARSYEMAEGRHKLWNFR